MQVIIKDAMLYCIVCGGGGGGGGGRVVCQCFLTIVLYCVLCVCVLCVVCCVFVCCVLCVISQIASAAGHQQAVWEVSKEVFLI